MSFQVDTALVQQYKANIQMKFQQTMSRLRPYVRVEQQNAEYAYYDRITATDVQEVTSRHGDSPLNSTPHDRRRVGLRDFDWGDMIDDKDKIRMLADPQSPYVANAVAAMMRKMDDVIISAATASAYAGKTGSTAVTFGNGVPAYDFMRSGSITANSATIPVDLAVASTNTNMNLDKLRAIRYVFDKTEATTEGDWTIALAMDPNQFAALLNSTSVTSADFNTVKALESGQLDTFMGIKFIKTNRLPVASSIRDCLAWERDGLLLAVGNEVQVEVQRRADKRFSLYLYVRASFGAVRMWEEKVWKVKCDETKAA